MKAETLLVAVSAMIKRRAAAVMELSDWQEGSPAHERYRAEIVGIDAAIADLNEEAGKILAAKVDE